MGKCEVPNVCLFNHVISDITACCQEIILTPTNTSVLICYLESKTADFFKLRSMFWSGMFWG